MKPAVFLDRDGVINRAIVRDGRPYPPDTLKDFEILPGVREAIEEFRRAGFLVIVTTNQPDVAKGKQKKSVVESMHELIRRELQVIDIKVCYHRDEDDCACRKPKPGMLLESAEEYGLDLKRSFMVGDRWRDMDAGRAAGCKTILIGTGYENDRKAVADFQASTLFEARKFIVSGS